LRLGGNGNHKIAGVRAGGGGEFCDIISADQLFDCRCCAFGGDFDEIGAASTSGLRFFRQLVELLARIACGAGSGESKDVAFDLQLLFRLLRERIGHFVQLHAETHVGLVTAVLADNVLVEHVRERHFGFDAGNRAGAYHDLLDDVEDVFLTGKDISRSSCVNSGWRSARRSSSRKHLTIWK
jgi:hypothetical protein